MQLVFYRTKISNMYTVANIKWMIKEKMLIGFENLDLKHVSHWSEPIWRKAKAFNNKMKLMGEQH